MNPQMNNECGKGGQYIMKLNQDYMLRSIAGEYVIVPTGDASRKLNGLITVNDTALVIWKGIEAGKSDDQIVQQLLEEFEVDRDLAEKDVAGFQQMLKEQGILLEDE